MTCGSIFDAARLKAELATIEQKLSDPSLWSNPQLSQPIMRDRKRIEEQLASDAELARRMGDIEAYFDLAREGEAVESDLERESRLSTNMPRLSKRAPCFPAKQMV